MVEKNQTYFNRLLALLDAVIAVFSYLLAWYLKFRSRLFSTSSVEAVPFRTYMSALFLIIPMLLILYWALGL